jgi:chromosome segregation ATPase
MTDLTAKKVAEMLKGTTRVIVGKIEKSEEYLGKEIQLVKNDVEDIKVELGEVKTDVEDIKVELGEVKADVEDIKVELGEVKATVERIENSILTDHDRRLRVLEKAVGIN